MLVTGTLLQLQLERVEPPFSWVFLEEIHKRFTNCVYYITFCLVLYILARPPPNQLCTPTYTLTHIHTHTHTHTHTHARTHARTTTTRLPLLSHLLCRFTYSIILLCNLMSLSPTLPHICSIMILFYMNCHA